MTTNRPEDAARHDTSDVLAGGEVGISREYTDQLAADPPGSEAPVPSRADAPPDAGGSRRRQRRRSFGTAGPHPRPARTTAPGRR